MGRKAVPVKLNGGPRDGEWITYEYPLPKTLVVSYKNDNKTAYADYSRKGEGDTNYYYQQEKKK